MKITPEMFGLTKEEVAQFEKQDKRIAKVRKEIDRTEYCADCKKYHNRPTWPNCTANRPVSYRTINGAA